MKALVMGGEGSGTDGWLLEGSHAHGQLRDGRRPRARRMQHVLPPVCAVGTLEARTNLCGTTAAVIGSSTHTGNLQQF